MSEAISASDLRKYRKKIAAKLHRLAPAAKTNRVACQTVRKTRGGRKHVYRCPLYEECQRLEAAGKEVCCELPDSEAGIDFDKVGKDVWLTRLHEAIRDEDDPFQMDREEARKAAGYLPYGNPDNRKKKRKGRGKPPPQIGKIGY